MNKTLATLGALFLIIGFLILIYGLTATYHCPAEYYQNGQLVGGCGNTPLIFPLFGIALMVVGAILLILSVKNPFNKKLTSASPQSKLE